MRKMMNKKGFSLVELMIVVVIMGILIAVAIPLYGAITANANNKTCSTNIENIKQAAVTYKASYDVNAKAADFAIESMMDDNTLPKCPLATDTAGAYGIAINEKGGAVVICPNTADSHAPAEDTEEAFAAATLYQAAGTAVTD